jgi:hypothetical protein
MWKHITDPDLMSVYAKEFGEKIPGLDRLVHHLGSRHDLPDLYAVTSHGNLRLTTATSFVDESKHPTIHIGKMKNGNLAVAFVPPRSNRPSAEKQCEPDQLISTVELFLLRVKLEG